MKDPNFNLFFATGSKQYLEFLLICNIKNILISFAYPEPWRMKGIIKRNNVKLLCDSGAFTSWNLSQKKKREGDANWAKHLINIDEYAKFLDKHSDIIYRAVNLDVIPGEQGSPPTQEQILDAAEEGWKNYLYLKSKGHDTIHVFHQGEPLWVLDRMLKECDYIGISPNNDASEASKFRWMDYTFRHIAESENPNIKTHGFAVTSAKLVKRYPWKSVDSSSYSITSALGSVLTKYGRIYVSDQNHNKEDHILKKPDLIKKHINDYLMERIGYGIKSMSDRRQQRPVNCPQCLHEIEVYEKIQAYKPRNFANIIYYQELQEERREKGPSMDFMKQKTLL